MALATDTLQVAGNATLVSILAALSGGTSKTQIVGSGGQVMPAGDAAARPVFVELSDGAAAFGTSGNPVRTQEKPPAASTDAGQNLSLADTASHAFASAACPSGYVIIQADPANTANISIARATGVTSGASGKGIVLQAGDVIVVPAANASEWFAIAVSATQNAHAVAL